MNTLSFIDSESANAGLFAFNDDAGVALARIGRRAVRVSIIDGVFHDAKRVAAFGFAQSYAGDRSNLYPGVRTQMPGSFSSAFRAWVTSILRRNGILESNQYIDRDESFFSIVTTPSADLLPIQCIPHYDSTDPDLLAAVIYLCDSRFSGTSFYRHRRTGYEEITEENRKNYQLSLGRDLRVHGVPKREYMNGENFLFESIFSNDLKFNSAIIYPSRTLHAANIKGPFTSPKTQSDWRLTVTALLHSARTDHVS